MDICGLNAQGLRGQRIREELWGPLTPAPRVARRLSVLKINRHVTAERSQVCRINSLALNYGPSFLGLFSNNNTFEGDPVRNHFGDTKREPRAAGCQLPVSPTSPGHEGRDAERPIRLQFVLLCFNVLLLEWPSFKLYRGGRKWVWNLSIPDLSQRGSLIATWVLSLLLGFHSH